MIIHLVLVKIVMKIEFKLYLMNCLSIGNEVKDISDIIVFIKIIIIELSNFASFSDWLETFCNNTKRFVVYWFKFGTVAL